MYCFNFFFLSQQHLYMHLLGFFVALDFFVKQLFFHCQLLDNENFSYATLLKNTGNIRVEKMEKRMKIQRAT